MSYKNLLLLFLSLWVFSEADAGYYNMGAMLQGPRLVFSVSPPGSVTLSTSFPTSPSVSVVKSNGSIISAGSYSVTITAHTDSLCTTAASGTLSATTNPVTSSSGTAVFSNMSYNQIGKIYLKAKATGTKSVCSSAIIVANPVTPSPNPTSFKFTLEGPNSIGTNNCTAYNVVLKDEYNNLVTTTSTVNINYTGAGTGSFYSNVGCTTTTTTGSIASNTNQTTVYYKTANVETNVLQATDPTSQVMNGSIAVDVTSTKLTLTGPQVANITPTCIGPYTINYLTAAGGNAGVTNVTLSRNTLSSETIYSSAGCTGSLTFPATIATNASGVATFYFKGPTLLPTSGPITLTVSATDSASASLDIGIGTGGTITKLSLVGTTTPVTSRCTQYYVYTQDASSVNQPVGTATTITNFRTGSGITYSDYSCKTATSSIVIPAGYSQGIFYFKDTVAEASTFTAQSSGLTQSALNLTTSGGSSPKISGGAFHTCALMADQTVKCWGDNMYGQLGNGTTISSYTPVLVTGLTGVTAISSGYGSTCALLSGGTVKCWGLNSAGQLGNGTTTNSPIPVLVSSISSITAVSVGDQHACALNASTAYCWGKNTYGALGNGTTTDSSTAVTVGSLGGTAIAIAAGQDHSCAILSGGTGKCWGLNTYGALGNGTTTNSSSPVTVSGLTTATSISIGNQTSCAQLASSVKCWGFNNYGQLGNGTLVDSSTPVTVSGITTISSISVGNNHSCVLLTSGAIKCWGSNNYGQLGNNTETNSSSPVDVSGITSTGSSVTAGTSFTCAMLTDQTAKCWGDNTNGQLGNGNNSNILTPAQHPTLSNVTAVTLANSSTCVLLANNTVKCWGSNIQGTLGDGTNTFSPNPVSVVGISTATAIAGGGVSGHICALLSSQGIKCWGNGGSGQLGNGASTSSNTPVDVTGIATATAVVTGASHSCALLADQTVKCWGLGTSGQLGNNTGASAATPVSVSGITNAIALYAGTSHTCALLSNQAVKCWGLGTSGQLGNNTSASSNVPVDVSGISTAISISGGSNAHHTCVILSDQTAKCWGTNTYGQLGDNSTTNSSVPVSVGALSTGYSIFTSGNYSCVVLTDKSMRCWGLNTAGQLGIGNTQRQSLPTPILSTTAISNAYTNTNNVCAVAPDKTLSCWGSNFNRQPGITYLVPGFVLNIPQ